MASTRPSPKGIMSARAGNYRAPVDTTGMDESMKETLGAGGNQPNIQVPAWMKALGSSISGMFNRSQPGRPATPHPAPTQEITPAQADSIYNKYVAQPKPNSSSGTP